MEGMAWSGCREEPQAYEAGDGGGLSRTLTGREIAPGETVRGGGCGQLTLCISLTAFAPRNQECTAWQ